MTGGFDLGLERAGFDIKWQIEINEFCQQILKQHWPAAKLFASVKTVDIDKLPRVDVLCGGFPCQPVSYAGLRKGRDDARWMWPQFARFIRLLRPEYVIIENTPGLYTCDNGELFRDILKEFATCGYNAEWDCLSAEKFGAPHKRERVWIIGYSDRRIDQRKREPISIFPARIDTGCFSEWPSASRVARVDDGVPNWSYRVKALGNACVPQITEYIGDLIKAHMEATDYGVCATIREDDRSYSLNNA